MNAMRSTSTLVLACLSAHYVNAATRVVNVPAGSKTYGADGPWNALSVQIGAAYPYFDAEYAQTFDVYPGGYLNSFFLTDHLCGSNAECGLGARFSPDDWTGSDSISWRPFSTNAGNNGIYVEGSVYGQTLNFQSFSGDLSGSSSVPNSSIVGVDEGYYVSPTGMTNSTSIELGFLTLGGDRNADYDGIQSWNPSTYFANVNITASNSFGLHIGSALFDYGPAMYYGGYDRGRTVGPVVTFGKTSPYLQDIIIGVETGGSPFMFDTQNDLLRDNSSASGANKPIPVFPTPEGPYLSLPKQTCDRIASFLPVTFDSSTNFYLWNTNDPQYKSIVSSPAYLGFVFPIGTTGSTTTIKVPFAVLNLTLESTLTGKSSAVTYFPCQPYTPSLALDTNAFYPSSGAYILGRAFLQAAFVGRNWGQSISWITQAPGPGIGRQGLTQQVTPIAANDLMIETYADQNLFNSSWAPYWTPLAARQNETNNDNVPNHHGLSTGAQAGIGVGVGVVGLVAIGALVFFLLRRRKEKSKPRQLEMQVSGPPPIHSSDQKDHQAFDNSINSVQSPPTDDSPRLSGVFGSGHSPKPTSKAYNWGNSQQPHELQSMNEYSELPSERHS